MSDERKDPYEIDAWTLAAAAEFVKGLNELHRKTRIDLEASYGGLSRDHMLIGNLRWNGDEFVIDVRHQ